MIGAKVFCRKGVEKDERAKQIESAGEAKLLKDQNDEIKVIQDSAYARMRKMLLGKEAQGKPGRRQGQGPLQKGDVLDDELLATDPLQVLGARSVGRPADAQGPRASSEPRGEHGGREARSSARRSPGSRRATSSRRASSRW